MQSSMRMLAGAVAAFSLCASPSLAATTAVQPINPLVAVSVFGTQASVQAVCSQGASAATAAGAAVTTQGQAGCVLPATDVPPPVGESPTPAPLAATGNFGINWLLLGLSSLALLAGIATLFHDDDDDGAPISPF